MFNASKKWDLEKNYYQTTCSEASIQRCSEKQVFCETYTKFLKNNSKGTQILDTARSSISLPKMNFFIDIFQVFCRDFKQFVVAF